MTAMRLKRYPSPSGGLALGKMGVGATMLKQGKTARDYVQDGLIAMWDGIENAGWGTHDANATSWKDLVGTHDMSPNTGYDAPAVGDDCFVFSTDLHNFVATLDYNASNTSYLPMSIEVAYRTSKRAGNNLIVSCWVGNQAGIKTARYWGSKIYGEGNAFSTFEETCGEGTLAFTRTTGTRGSFRVYFSSVLKSESSSWSLYASPIQLGRAVGTSTSSWYFVGDVCAVRCYSRALTADDIAANSEIDKERFNLP